MNVVQLICLIIVSILLAWSVVSLVRALIKRSRNKKTPVGEKGEETDK